MSMIVDRFLQWTRTAPVARRAEAADALARSYLCSPLSAEERDQVEAAMTVLLDDPAPEVRIALAQVLAPSDMAPHHMILALAADRTRVAAIVAEHSPLLLDTEVVDLIAAGDETMQLAIARRPFVSRSIAAALAEVGSPDACLALLANEHARVPRFSLDRIIERHGSVPEVRQALLDRPDLPLDVRQILLTKLTASLCELLVSRDWLTADRAEVVTREARDRATIAAAFEAPADNMPALVEQLIGAGELTPLFLVRAAASGQTLLFETALAALANIPHQRVSALLASGHSASVNALLQRAGLPPQTYPAFNAAIDVICNGDADPGALSDYRRATKLIDAIVHRYQAGRDRELDQILALLRRFATEAKRSAARGYAQQVMEAA